jgi:phosphinothricin acetyltransferase
MLACEIRTATVHDMASVTSIYAHFVRTSTASFELTPPDLPEMLRRRQSVLDHGLPYLVAELEGYIVGYTYASQFRPREGYRFTVEDSIYVRADCVGYGVGRRLLSSLIQGCEAAACHRMVACICGKNPVSVALHASQGFTPVGTMPEVGFKFGEWIDMSLMQRSFPAGQ